MRTLLPASRQPSRTSLALLAALLVALVMGMVATPSPAAAATTPAVKGGATGLTAVLDMHTVARIRAANGALQACVAGDKARATNQWTNAYGQTLYVEMYVGVNSDCQVRFREHLRASGSSRCNFDSDNAAIYASNTPPPNITKPGSYLMGHANWPPYLDDADCNVWYTGTWRTPPARHVISSDGAFHVHFLSPDHQGVDHRGCSQAWDHPYRVSRYNPCFYWAPGDS
jgi:hypothetical protein